MLVSTAIVTVSVVEPTMPVVGSLAVIVGVPVDTPVARPSLPAALEIVAAALDDDQVTDAVIGWVLPSE
jgi:hypothetical protein